MKHLLIITLSLCAAAGAADNVNSAVNAADLIDKTPVIGRTGEHLGKIITLTGRRIATHTKDEEGRVVFEIEAVNDKPLDHHATIVVQYFSWTGIKPPDAGERHSYRGYETGGCDGIPSDAFKEMDSAQATDFHFDTWFQVIVEPKK